MAKRTVLIAISALSLTVLTVVSVWIWISEWSERALELGEQATIVINPGRGFASVSEELEQRGIVDSSYLLKVLAWLSGTTKLIHAGEYHFDGSVSPQLILETLVNGKVVEYPFLLPEGSTFVSMLRSFGKTAGLEHDLTGQTVDTVLTQLNASGNAEGWFFPDTYSYRRGEKSSVILRRSYERMQQELNLAWNNRHANLPYRSDYELLIMASIVEKESSRFEDRLRVAGVLIRRLQQGMRLQVDPTVIYGLGDDFDGNLTRKHLKMPSPYNTYLNYGLPPTPICSPSKDSLLAAARPADGDELYFVARGDGSTHFSSTLQEHQRAVRKYQIGN